MGGDHAPKAPVLGAIEAAKLWGEQIVLVGREDEIRAAAKEAGFDTLPSGIATADIRPLTMAPPRRNTNAGISVWPVPLP
jgi:glycerol-3-phosphate acyltransferase PlsX